MTRLHGQKASKPLPPAARQTLLKWFTDNFAWPYPEVGSLGRRGGGSGREQACGREGGRACCCWEAAPAATGTLVAGLSWGCMEEYGAQGLVHGGIQRPRVGACWGALQDAVKQQLAASSGLDMKQVNDWLTNYRKRHWLRVVGAGSGRGGGWAGRGGGTGAGTQRRASGLGAGRRRCCCMVQRGEGGVSLTCLPTHAPGLPTRPAPLPPAVLQRQCPPDRRGGQAGSGPLGPGMTAGGMATNSRPHKWEGRLYIVKWLVDSAAKWSSNVSANLLVTQWCGELAKSSQSFRPPLPAWVL